MIASKMDKGAQIEKNPSNKNDHHTVPAHKTLVLLIAIFVIKCFSETIKIISRFSIHLFRFIIKISVILLDVIVQNQSKMVAMAMKMYAAAQQISISLGSMHSSSDECIERETNKEPKNDVQEISAAATPMVKVNIHYFLLHKNVQQTKINNIFCISEKIPRCTTATKKDKKDS